MYLGVENRIQNTGHKWFWFSIGCCVVDQRSGNDWFFGRVESLAISLWKGFTKFLDVGCQNCLCSEHDYPEFSLQEEGQSRGTEPRKRTGFCEEDTFHDLRVLSSDWRSWYTMDHADVFSVTLLHDNGQKFSTRLDEVLLSVQNSSDVMESLNKLRIRAFAKLKTVMEFITWIFVRNIDA